MAKYALASAWLAATLAALWLHGWPLALTVMVGVPLAPLAAWLAFIAIAAFGAGLYAPRHELNAPQRKAGNR